MKKDYFLRKTHEMDKDRFAQMLLAAKGSRTMKDFADLCGVNPSTFTRIIQKTNKGASSAELIEAIAAHTANNNVTLENLADANGYTVERTGGIKASRLSASFENAEALVLNVLTQALIDRGHGYTRGSIRYQFSKSLALSPDALIKTDAFGNGEEIWFVDSILATPRRARVDGNPLDRSRVKQMAFDKISRFVFISMNKIDLFRPSRFSLVVFDREVYDVIVEEFYDTNVSTDISIIHIDSLNNCIADEFMLPHINKGHQPSYFMNTHPVTSDLEYLGSYIDEEDTE